MQPDSTQHKPRVLIGAMSKSNDTAVPIVSAAFAEGLKNKFTFFPFYTDRRFGKGDRARMNIFNLFYFLKHLVLLVGRLLWHRPQIFHYAITSEWNLEKSFLFLATARLFGTKTVGHLHGGSFDAFWDTLPEARKRRNLRHARRLDAFVALGEWWRRWAIEHMDLDPARVYVVNNPIPSEFERAVLRQPPAENDEIFFLGSIGKRKGVYDILAAAALLKDRGVPLSITLAGPEEKANELALARTIIAERCLDNVRLIPPVHGKEKIDLFRTKGILLFPSYNENLPLVVLEAAAAARAIITTRVGAIPEFFTHRASALFVSAGNVEEIVSAVLEVKHDTAFRRRLGVSARTVFIERLSRERIMQSMETVYLATLSGKVSGNGSTPHER